MLVEKINALRDPAIGRYVLHARSSKSVVFASLPDSLLLIFSTFTSSAILDIRVCLQTMSEAGLMVM